VAPTHYSFQTAVSKDVNNKLFTILIDFNTLNAENEVYDSCYNSVTNMLDVHGAVHHNINVTLLVLMCSIIIIKYIHSSNTSTTFYKVFTTCEYLVKGCRCVGRMYIFYDNNINRIEITNRMRPCSRIYYSSVS